MSRKRRSSEPALPAGEAIATGASCNVSSSVDGVDAFKERGYCVLNGLLSAQEVEVGRRIIDECNRQVLCQCKQASPHQRPCSDVENSEHKACACLQIQSPLSSSVQAALEWQTNLHCRDSKDPAAAWLRALACTPGLVRAVWTCCCPSGADDPALALLGSQIFSKPPRQTSDRAVPWHQDGREAEPGEAPPTIVTAWVAFDEIVPSQCVHVAAKRICQKKIPSVACSVVDVPAAPTDDVSSNGGLLLIPGVHKSAMDLQTTRYEQITARLTEPAVTRAIEDSIAKGFEGIVEYSFKSGTTALHHHWTPHSSGPNRSNHWRRVVVLRYTTMSALKGTDEEPLFTELARVPGDTPVDPHNEHCANDTGKNNRSIRIFSLAAKSRKSRTLAECGTREEECILK